MKKSRACKLALLTCAAALLLIGGVLPRKFANQDSILSSYILSPHPETHSLPICIAVLAFEGVVTLEQTLSSNKLLFQMVAETIILFQDVGDRGRMSWAKNVVEKHKHFQPIFAQTNIGQRAAFELLSQSCSQPFIIILEEDFRAAENADFRGQLEHGLRLIRDGVDAVRLRSRKFPGEPNYAHMAWLNGGGWLGGKIPATHLIEYVTWSDSPKNSYLNYGFVRKFQRLGVLHPRTQNTPMTQPCLYATDFLRNLVFKVPEASETHFENWLTEHWSSRNFTVAYSDGLFTHDRLDRTLGIGDNLRKL